MPSPNEGKTNYLAKLLTLLVKRDNGIIRIPIGDLMVDDIGQGFQVHFDQSSKELVLSFVPAGTTTYKIEGSTTWLSQPLPQNNPPASRPLNQDELVERIWRESAATPTLSETRNSQPQPDNRPNKPKVVHITDETIIAAEDEKRKREVMREIENYQTPQPATRPPSRQTVIFSKP